MATTTISTSARAPELEPRSEPMLYGDMLEVDLRGFSLDFAAHGYEAPLSWSWSSSPEWTLS